MMVLAKRFKELGCFVDVERAIPSLHKVDNNGVVTEAILDVVCSTPGALMSSMLDVTIRCPHAVRTSDGHRSAASQPAQAAIDGEQEKAARYGAAVKPIAFETYGRMGPCSMAALKGATLHLSSLKRGVRGSGQSLYAMMRLDLERALIQAVADTTLRALGHGSALHACHRRRGAAGEAAAARGRSE